MALDKSSSLQRFADKLKQRLRRRIVWQPEFGVDSGVVRFFGTEDGRGNAGVLENAAETLSLGRVIGVIGDVQDQKRRDALVPGDMRDGREVAMLLRIVAEFLAMAELCFAAFSPFERPPSRLDSDGD